MSLFTANRKYLKSVLFSVVLILFMAPALFAQVTGDYRTNGNGTDWNTANNWDRYDGSTWVSPSPTYPGEDATAQTITILAGNGVQLSASPAYSITNLVVEDGAATELDLNSYTLTVSGDVTIDGDVDDTGGGAVLEVAGNFTINSTATWGGFTSLTFNGSSGTQTISGTFDVNDQIVVDNLTVNASGATVDNNLASEIYIAIQFTLAAGTFEAGSATYTFDYGAIDAVLFNKTGGTFDPETSTFIVTSNRNVQFSTNSSISFYNLEHFPNLNATLSLDETTTTATYTITNELRISPRSQGIRLLNQAVLGYSGTTSLIYTTNNNIDMTNEWPALNGPTNVSVTTSGTYTLGDSRTIDGTFTKAGSGTLNLSGSSTLVINTGAVFELNAGIFTVGSGNTLEVNGRFDKGNGTFNLNSGTLTYGASSTLRYTAGQNAGDEWPTPIANVIIQTGTVTLPTNFGPRTITTDLTVNSTLTANNNALTIGDNLTVNGTLTLNGVSLEVGNNTTLGSSASVNTNNGDFSTGTVSGGSLSLGSSATLATGTGTVTVVTGNTSLSNNAEISSTADLVFQGDVSMQSGSSLNTSANAVIWGNLTVTGGATIGQTTAGNLVMDGNGTSNVDVDGQITLFDFTVAKAGGNSVIVSAVEGSQLRFNDNATLSVQQGILQLSSTAQILDASGGTINDNNLTLAIEANGTLRTGGTVITGFADYQLEDGSTIEFTGTEGTESVPANATLGNITINNSSTSGVNLSGNVTLQTNSTIDVVANRRFNLQGYSITHAGSPADQLIVETGASLYTEGSAITGFSTYTLDGTIVFNGTTADENLPGGVDGNAFNLTVNKSNGYNLVVSDAVTIGGPGNTLTLANGLITFSGSGALTLAAGTATSGGGAASYVDGTVSRIFNSAIEAGTVERVLPIGSNGSYRPVRLDFSNLSGSVTITATQNETAPSGTLPSGISGFATGLSRFWTVDATGTGTFDDFNMDLVYTGTSDPQSSLRIINGENGSGYTTVGTTTTYPETGRIQAVFTSFSDFAIGRASSVKTWDGGALTSNWSDAANWNDDIVPQNGDIIDLSAASATTVNYDASTSQNQFASISVGNNITLSLDRSTTIDLTATSNALVVLAGGELIFNNTLISMAGSSYNSARTNYEAGSIVEYVNVAVYTDTYGGNLLINGASGSSGSGTISVGGNLEKQSATAFSTSQEVTVTGTYTNTAGNATYNGGLTVSGNTTLTAGTVGGTVILNGSTVTVNGGSFGGTVTLSGSAAQSIAGSATATFNSLTVDNSNGIILNTNSSVGGILRLSNGVVTTGSNVFTILSSGTFDVDNSTGYILGNSANQFGSTFVARYFPVGSSGRTRYVQLFGSSASGTISITCNLVDEPATNITTTLGGLLTKVSELRYYSFSNNSGVQFNIRRVEKLRVNNDDGVGDFFDNTTLRMATTIGTGNTWAERTLGVANTQAPLPADISSNNFSSDDAVSTGSVWYLALGTTDISDNPLPVQLAAFEALADFGKVTLNWTTASELDNLGFNIYRADADENNWQQINSQLIAGQGNTAQSTDYSFVDSKVVGGETYHYKLESVSTNGLRVDEKTIEVNIPLPDQYVLFNNYPNPFNPTTNIKFQLPEAQPVKMVIYDMNGSQVKTLLNNQVYHAGEHVVSWDASDQNGNRVASGIYLYRFQAGSYHKTGKMILVK